MLIRLNQRGGSLLTRVGDVKVALRAGKDHEVPDAVGAALVADYDNIEAVMAEPVVIADVEEAPAEEMPAEPEQPTTSTTGAMSTADLKAGGKRGRSRRKAT